MRRALRIDPSDAVPIWHQIELEMRRLVASRILPLGAVVPSVRDMARDLRVNPATVAKAYRQLTAAGLLEVKRGEGTFVAESLPELPADERDRRLSGGAERYASLAAALRAQPEEAGEALSRAWEELEIEGEQGP